jgi:short-subunit dehydrogenase
MKENRKFNNKKCWITGGGSGIGKALALQLSSLGADVYISGRSEESLQVVCKLDHSINYIILDVTDTKSWSKASAIIKDKFGHLDFMIFNAGTCKYIDLPTFSSDVFREVMNVNYMGIVNGLESVLPLLRQSDDAHITAVTSSVARLPLPRAEAYGASKAAATYLMSSLRLALAGSGIGVSVVLPGFVKTAMTDANDFDMPFIISPEEGAQKIIKGISKKHKEIYFPGRFTWPLRILAALPTSVHYHFTKRLVRL